jgi:phosphoglycolate phosphatase
MLLAALPRLGVAADEALYVGDMTVDVETARAAGVRVWVVPTGSDDIDALTRARPDRLLRDLHELTVLLGSDGVA